MTTILAATIAGLSLGYAGVILLLARWYRDLTARVSALEGEPEYKVSYVEETESFLHGDFFAPTGTDPR